jgi:hypothetical protein
MNRKALIFIVLMFLVFDFLFSILSTCQSGAVLARNDNCSMFSGVVPLTIGFVLHPLVGFLEKYEHPLVAGFTIILAIFTARLWYSTDKLFGATKELVDGAADTAKRQLRAYIEAIPHSIERNFGDQTVKITFTTKNTGATPARNVRAFSMVCILPSPLIAFNFTEPDESIVTAKTVIFPGGSFEQEAISGVKMPDALLDQVGQSKNIGLYLISRIRYDDAFGDPHETWICAYVNGRNLFDALAVTWVAANSNAQGKATAEIKFMHNLNYNEAT